MKDKYTSPVINTEELSKADVICDSLPEENGVDNRTMRGYSLLDTITEFFTSS